MIDPQVVELLVGHRATGGVAAEGAQPRELEVLCEMAQGKT